MIKAHYCRLKEKTLLQNLIEKKKQLLDRLLEQTLEQYQGDIDKYRAPLFISGGSESIYVGKF